MISAIVYGGMFLVLSPFIVAWLYAELRTRRMIRRARSRSFTNDPWSG